MSQLRRRWRVVVDDVEREIRTTAFDIAAIDENLPDAGWRTIHHAMVRMDIDGIPTEYHDWLNVLDEVEDLETKTSSNGTKPAGEGEAVEVADPTPTTPAPTNPTP